MSETNEAGEVDRRERPEVGDSARVHEVELPDGSAFTGGVGWHELNNGGKFYIRRDGSVSFHRWPTNARDAVGPAGNQGARGGLSPIVSGHTVTLVHGAWSARRVDPIAAELVETAVSSVAWLADATYRPAVTAWARAEARCQLLAEYLDEAGLLDPATGEPRPALSEAGRQEKLALQQRQRLGLDPASRSQLEATLTSARQGQVALEDAIRRGQEALAARQDAHGPTWGPTGAGADPSQTAVDRGAQGETGSGL